MFYKPNYCCNCGDKIERIEWNLLSSRRFCELCETENPLDKVLKIIFPTVLLLFGVFGISGYFYTPQETVSINKTEKKIITPDVEKNKSAQTRSRQTSNKSGQKPSGTDESGALVEKTEQTLQVPQKQSIAPEPDKPEEIEMATSPQKVAKETVYFCGAETKKGKPCSRRVKGGGRCWQHAGRNAMLPAKELRITN